MGYFSVGWGYFIWKNNSLYGEVSKLENYGFNKKGITKWNRFEVNKKDHLNLFCVEITIAHYLS